MDGFRLRDTPAGWYSLSLVLIRYSVCGPLTIRAFLVVFHEVTILLGDQQSFDALAFRFVFLFASCRAHWTTSIAMFAAVSLLVLSYFSSILAPGYVPFFRRHFLSFGIRVSA